MARREALPDLTRLEDTIYHLPVIEIRARVDRGWWSVQVRCEPQGPLYSGKMSRSYFSALAKAIAR